MNKVSARELRRNPTDSERTLWRHLRLRQLGGYKFRRQYPLGEYIVDFICLEKRLIIEVDGGQHSEQATYDSKRKAWLAAQGFYMLRFWNNQIFEDLEAVEEQILEALSSKTNPPP